MLIPFILIAFVISMAIACYQSEKRSWNNGVCKETGSRWILFDYDSQGGRGYVSGENYLWVSWPLDK